MDFTGKLLLIGGKSGVGKTSLVNQLIKNYPKTFQRPISYTSRKKRSNENDKEYHFCDEKEIISMYNEGKFLTLDHVYGNYYAMETKSIDDIIKEGMIPIKEIHPSNHNKIKSLYPNSISVLLTSFNADKAIDKIRDKEDEAYYKSINYNEFDIVFMVDKNHCAEDNVKYLYMKIINTLKYYSLVPSSGVIDNKNAYGYSQISSAFNDKKRITTKNFHDLSINFFQNLFKNIIFSGSSILEVGAGRGWLRKNFKWPDLSSYTCCDISSDMLSECNENKKVVSSVRFLPFKNSEFDYVVASLADPFLYPEALCELNRILRKDGILAFSTPSHMWATALRGEGVNKTTFVNGDDKVDVFSFTYDSTDLLDLFSGCGFELISIQEIKGDMLNADTLISPAITNAADNINVNINDLDIITTCTYKKI